jgi:hypothetical protein
MWTFQNKVIVPGAVMPDPAARTVPGMPGGPPVPDGKLLPKELSVQNWPWRPCLPAGRGSHTAPDPGKTGMHRRYAGNSSYFERLPHDAYPPQKVTCRSGAAGTGRCPGRLVGGGG